MDVKALLKTVQTVLVIDWPDREVPGTLARAGLQVVVAGGPGPDDYRAWEWVQGQIVTRHTGHRPERADLIYCYRPLSELPEIVAKAKLLHAHTIWTQSGFSARGVKDPRGCWVAEEELRSARSTIEAAGLSHVSAPYIADVAREIEASGVSRI